MQTTNDIFVNLRAIKMNEVTWRTERARLNK